MGRTNIKIPNRGSEYFIRPYARGKDDTYMDVSTQVTQAYVDTQVIMPHSIFSRPYLADAYPEMEYAYKPTIPVIPPFDPDTVPGGVPVVPIVPEVDEPITYIISSDSPTSTVRYDDTDLGFGPYFGWDAVHDAATGTGTTSDAVQGNVEVKNFDTGDPPPFYIIRCFKIFDTTGLSGTIISAKLVGPTADDNLVVQVGTFSSLPASVADYDSFSQKVPPNPLKGPILVDWEVGTGNAKFTSAGLSYLQSNLGSQCKFAFREKDHDYDDVPPPDSVAHGTNLRGTQLHITIA